VKKISGIEVEAIGMQNHLRLYIPSRTQRMDDYDCMPSIQLFRLEIDGLDFVL
jgi:hypothetical protein